MVMIRKLKKFFYERPTVIALILSSIISFLIIFSAAEKPSIIGMPIYLLQYHCPGPGTWDSPPTPSHGSTITTNYFAVQFTSSVPLLYAYVVRPSHGDIWSMSGGPLVWSAFFPPQPDGWQRIYPIGWCYMGGNFSAEYLMRYFFIDTTGPYIGFFEEPYPPRSRATPPHGAIITDSRNITILAWAMDNRGPGYVANCTLVWLGSEEPMEMSGTTPTNCIKDKTNLANGVYFYYVKATDAFGHLSSSPIRNFTIAVPLVLTLNYPTPANNFVQAQAWVYVNVTSNEALDIAILEWQGSNYTMSGSGTNWFYNKTGLSDGSYSYKVYGNRSDTGVWGVSETRIVNVRIAHPPSLNIWKVGNMMKLNWSQVPEAEGYKIWYSENLTWIISLNESNAPEANVTLVGATNTTWYDTTAMEVKERYYTVASYKGNLLNFTGATVGKYNITIYDEASIGQTLISFPLEQNITLSELLPSANNFAFIYTVNETAREAWLYAYFFNGNWITTASANLTYLEAGKGYYFDRFKEMQTFDYERNRKRKPEKRWDEW